MPRRKIKSIDFSTLPYSFQNRLIDLSSPRTLCHLRRTGHAIHKLTSRNRFYARSLIVGRDIKPDYNNLFHKMTPRSRWCFRFLDVDQLLTYKHVYVPGNILPYDYDIRLKSLFVPIYRHLNFVRGFTVPQMTQLICHGLQYWSIRDPTMLQTRLAVLQFFAAVVKYLRDREDRKFVCFTSILPLQYRNAFKLYVERECPFYSVSLTNEINIKHKNCRN